MKLITDEQEATALTVSLGVERRLAQSIDELEAKRPGQQACGVAAVNTSDGFYVFVRFANFASPDDNGTTVMHLRPEDNNEANREEVLARAIAAAGEIDSAGSFDPDTAHAGQN